MIDTKSLGSKPWWYRAVLTYTRIHRPSGWWTVFGGHGPIRGLHFRWSFSCLRFSFLSVLVRYRQIGAGPWMIHEESLDTALIIAWADKIVWPNLDWQKMKTYLHYLLSYLFVNYSLSHWQRKCKLTVKQIAMYNLNFHVNIIIIQLVHSNEILKIYSTMTHGPWVMDLSHFEPINVNIKSWLNLDDWRGCQSNEFEKRI